MTVQIVKTHMTVQNFNSEAHMTEQIVKAHMTVQNFNSEGTHDSAKF